jgi:hypothetical protein
LIKEREEGYEENNTFYNFDPGLAACGMCRRDENPHIGSC